MPRRRVAEKRETLPDPVYHNRLVAKFVNAMMRAGKKSLSEGIFYQSMGIIEARMKTDALAVFKQAVDNVKPMLQVKSRRVGGATYQVPIEVQGNRAASLAMRWLADFSKKRPGKSMSEKLANEIIDAANERGESVKKREDTHRMADANKAFAHYRW